jgi:sugar phosphate isomerase/epimerase
MLRLAISNIAWDVPEDESVAALLRRFSVDAIDVAPGKYFPDPAAASDPRIREVRSWWGERGIEITGMQSLLFGTRDLNVFGSAESQQRLLAHLGAVCRIGRVLGASRLVFGSPRNRDRTGLTDAQAFEAGVDFFRRLAGVAAAEGVVICLEPNPARYGANFMTSSAETARVVEAVGHPAVRMQLDTGAIFINAEDPGEVVQKFGGLIGHIHVSEPDLVPLGSGEADHGGVAAALSRAWPSALVSIEMVATPAEPHLASIERALRTADRHYRAPAVRSVR